MPLTSGSKLGPYEILSWLGAGGMGDVYKARDTRLERTVAIKVLPEHLSCDPDRRGRFEREARTLSSLNHAHICTLFDIGRQDGIDYLVMEYLEGETLLNRLSKGSLPLDGALKDAVEIADALDKAHRQGIVHRDLKPGNIMLTKSGAKLLDFGLAKFKGVETVVSLSALPTQQASLTAEGTILGTFQYMAPEQLEGKEADARTDIFTFGAVLYEMLTGNKAFQGKTQASLIGSILKEDPAPVSRLQPLASPGLDRVVRTCLAKDPDDRWQSASDLVKELKWLSEAGSQVGVPVRTKTRRRVREILVNAVAVGAVLIAAFLAMIHFNEPLPKANPIRFRIEVPETLTFFANAYPVISPDGKRVVFSASSVTAQLLWMRSMDSLQAQPIPGTEAGYYPFWSPDSRFVGFLAGAKLKRVDVTGGPPQTLCDAPGVLGAAWNHEGRIILGSLDSGLKVVPATGGLPKPLTRLDKSKGEISHRWPSFLPDGKHFIYLALTGQGDETQRLERERQAMPVRDQPILPLAGRAGNPAERRSGLYIGSLDSNETKELAPSISNALYSPPGYILFVREGNLLAQRFDPDNLQLKGEPFPVVEGVPLVGITDGGAFSLSADGVLTYRSGSSLTISQLVWYERGGRELGKVGDPADYTNPAFSPDEKRLAVCIRDRQSGLRDIWIFDLIRGTKSRLTLDPGDDLNPVWSHDGTQILFTSHRKGNRDIYHKMATGTGDDKLLFDLEVNLALNDCSPDGKYAVSDTGGSGDLWILPLDRDKKPYPFLKTSFGEREAQFSPDGKWIAYSSSETGSYEVYVQSFPPTGEKWPISTTGGEEPQWRRDGKELFYIAGGSLMAVDIRTGPSGLEAGIPKPLFEAPLASGPWRNRYLVTRDGQRFLVHTAVQQSSAPPFIAVINWTAALENQ